MHPPPIMASAPVCQPRHQQQPAFTCVASDACLSLCLYFTPHSRPACFDFLNSVLHRRPDVPIRICISSPRRDAPPRPMTHIRACACACTRVSGLHAHDVPAPAALRTDAH